MNIEVSIVKSWGENSTGIFVNFVNGAKQPEEMQNMINDNILSRFSTYCVILKACIVLANLLEYFFFSRSSFCVYSPD